MPSRARVSPDGRYGVGHAVRDGPRLRRRRRVLHADRRSSTSQRGEKIADLEDFAVTHRRTSWSPRSTVNFWGVTFAHDSDRSTPRCATGGKTHLIEGSIREPHARASCTQNVECPSLSPDGTRIAYKKRVDDGSTTWRLHVLDLATMRETPLAEPRIGRRPGGVARRRHACSTESTPRSGASRPRARESRAASCAVRTPHRRAVVKAREDDVKDPRAKGRSFPMTSDSLRGERVLITGGAGAIGSNLCDQLVQRDAGEIVVLDNFVRGRRENLAWARGQRPRDASSRATSATARSSRELTRGIDVVFHQAAIRITQCAEEPRLALEVLVDGTFNVLEAAADANVRKVVAASSASVYGLAEEFPTDREAPPVRQRHALRRRQGLQRGTAAQLPRDERPRLRRAALLQRLRPAHGHLRRLHRGAGALDGAHRRRRAAADLRRRHADDGLRLRRATSRAPTCSPPRPTSPTRSSTSPAASRRASRAGGDAAARSWARTSPVEHGPERAVNKVVAPARRHLAARASALGFEAEIGLEEGLDAPRRLVAANRADAAQRARRARGGVVMQVPFARPYFVRRRGRGASPR